MTDMMLPARRRRWQDDRAGSGGSITQAENHLRKANLLFKETELPQAQEETHDRRRKQIP
jgi:hypothetical protein